MRSLIVKSAMAGAVLLLASGTARASDVLQVNVPFSFQVGKEMFPAGRYMLSERPEAALRASWGSAQRGPLVRGKSTKNANMLIALI